MGRGVLPMLGQGAPTNNPPSETVSREKTMEQSAVNEPGATPIPVFMEHRWGQRLPCRAHVRFCGEGGVVGAGRIRDISSSGAFIETAVVLHVYARVALVVLGNESATRTVELDATVVRVESDGIAVEWCESPAGSICGAVGCTAHCER